MEGARYEAGILALISIGIFDRVTSEASIAVRRFLPHCKNSLADQQSTFDKIGAAVKEKNEAIKTAIAQHLQEFLASRPDVPLMVISCSEVFWDRLAHDYLTEPLPPPPVRPGHPFDLDDLGSVAYPSRPPPNSD